jgi:hypothetical protein
LTTAFVANDELVRSDQAPYERRPESKPASRVETNLALGLLVLVQVAWLATLAYLGVIALT